MISTECALLLNTFNLVSGCLGTYEFKRVYDISIELLVFYVSVLDWLLLQLFE